MKRLRTLALAIVALATVAGSTVPAAAQNSPADGVDAVIEQLEESNEGLALDEIENLDDLGPNPWLSLTPDHDPEAVAAWQKVAAQLPDDAQVPAYKGKKARRRVLNFSEKENSGQVGRNDTAQTGDFIRKFGTARGKKGHVTIRGSLSGGTVRPPIEGDCESSEDDGSIDQANPTPAAEIQVALCVGEIGDGPFGASTGDIDFYSYGTVEEGAILILDVSHVSGSLDPANTITAIYDNAGNILASAEDPGIDDDPSGAPTSFLEVVAPSTGEYFAAVAGCCELSFDPSNPGSGPGVGETGTYEVFVVAFPPPCASVEDDGSIAQANRTNVNGEGADVCAGVLGDGPHGAADTDFYALGSVEAGAVGFFDVFGFEGALASVVGLYNASGELVASFESTGEFEDGPPADEPLPEDGEEAFAGFEFTESGEYFVAVSGCCEVQQDPTDPASGVASEDAGLYELVIEVFVPFIPTCFSTEDDGAISSANDASDGLLDPELFINECVGVIGDGPQAEANGDVDFFQTRVLPEGQVLGVDFIDFGEAAGAGDLTIGIYNEAGELLATGQDDPADSGPESDFFRFVVPAEGAYYVAVGGAMPSNPKDPTSGTNTEIVSSYDTMFIIDAAEEFFGAPAQGLTSWKRTDRANEATSQFRSMRKPENRPLAKLAAKLRGAKAEADAQAEKTQETAVDTDFFLVKLKKGDAISGGFDDARTVGIIDPAGVQRSGSPFNPSFIYPEDSPLRHDRRNGFDHVATVNGIHAVFVTDGISDYEGELKVVKSGLANERNRNQQIIYVDFDGASVSADVFGTVDAELSPLSAFLPAWDLGPNDADTVIDATLDAIVETVDQDLRIRDGRNGNRDRTRNGTQFDVEILNSRDHREQWGRKNVTRVIIGGTIDEIQIPTLGIAESVDPGNTETEETALVLLDVMSAPAGSDASINSYEVAAGSTKAEFVGFTLGHIAAHEVGHLIGNWHQESFNEIDALMDAGGDFPAISGVGPDGVFGTTDDTDPDFKEDIFSTIEGFTGVEDSPGRSAFAFSTGTKKAKKVKTYKRNRHPADHRGHGH